VLLPATDAQQTRLLPPGKRQTTLEGLSTSDVVGGLDKITRLGPYPSPFYNIYNTSFFSVIRIFMLAQSIALTASLLTIITNWLVGNNKSSGWLIGLLSNAVWLLFIFVFSAWGLLPLTIAMIYIQTRNYIKWKKEKP